MRLWGPRADKKWRHPIGRDIVDALGLPLGLPLFVDRQGTDALHGFCLCATSLEVIGVKAMTHQIALHAQIIGQAQVPTSAYLLKADRQHER
jgi:hypothetical protein